MFINLIELQFYVPTDMEKIKENNDNDYIYINIYNANKYIVREIHKKFQKALTFCVYTYIKGVYLKLLGHFFHP